MTLDDINTLAWRDFLTWAWNEPEMRAEFTAKTGLDIQAVTSPINAAIDAATSANASVLARFIEWATCEHWGLEHAPSGVPEGDRRQGTEFVSARVIRTLSEAEVIRRWAELYAAGKHQGYAPPNPEPYLGRDATWVEVEVPHDLYDADWNTDAANLSPTQLARAERYARMPGPLPPGIAGYQGRRATRGLGRLYVSDGNHRAYAAFLRGSPTAHFYIPQSEWRRFQQVQEGIQI